MIAHVLISRFVDHLPYYRQESINARSNVHTPRSTLASWSGQGGAALQPLFDVHRVFILQSNVLHADETPVRLLDPGAGKTKRAYVWAYARSKFDLLPGVIVIVIFRIERARVQTGSGSAGPIDYSLNHWDALTENLSNGDVAVDNNHCENQMRPWSVGREA